MAEERRHPLLLLVRVGVGARELVPGDVERLRPGNVVPADARLLDATSLQVDQSALTGESLTVSLAQGGVLFSGSIVVRGEGDGLVFATAADSCFGRTTRPVETAGTVSRRFAVEDQTKIWTQAWLTVHPQRPGVRTGSLESR